MTLPVLASAARCAAGRPARMTAGLVVAAMSGIRSTQEGCAQPAFTFANGLRPSASSVAAGRRIQTGMRSDLSDDDSNIPVRSPAWKQWKQSTN